jgi:murein DD-endopeptidase MepM/ murein hydrolase activator NlpD
LAAPVATQFYQTQSGDTLPALAARFGVNPADIQAPNGLISATFLGEGQLLIIPNVLPVTGPGTRLAPDSEVVFGGGAASFDPQALAVAQGGYLAHYKGYAENRTQRGGDELLLIARNHSINPRLLMTLLEQQSGWVTNPAPEDEALRFPLGWQQKANEPLYAQLSWASAQLAIGYYGWRAGTLTELTFPNGETLRLNPTLNAGTVAVQYFFSRLYDQAAWEGALVSFDQTNRMLFGDPFARAVDPLLPVDLAQLPLSLPFQRGRTWYYSGGPHGAWENGGAQAAVDFAPGSLEGGCADSPEWVTAMAAGQVLRSNNGSVILDLDGDGRETTGWVLLYLHVAEKDRVAVGTFVERGAKLGRPSCEGGVATGTHVHIARKYNGEWIPADGPVPFVLSGWAVKKGSAEYLGDLEREGVTVEACTCTAAWTAVTADR